MGHYFLDRRYIQTKGCAVVIGKFQISLRIQILKEMPQVFPKNPPNVNVKTLRREHAYNVLVSRRIGPARQLPDTRHKGVQCIHFYSMSKKF